MPWYDFGSSSSRRRSSRQASTYGTSRRKSYGVEPRSGFISRTIRKIRRMLRDLLYWAKKHPMKVFMLVVVPLLTGGGLLATLNKFGIRLPPEVTRLMGGSGGGSGRGEGIGGFASTAAQIGGGLGSAATIMKAVQMFM